ncbi:MAG: hypothetical protein ACRDLE_04885 [Gaiellaceae bacterium]
MVKLVSLALAAGVLAVYASSASAAPASHSNVADLCTAAKGIASSIAHSGVGITPSAGQSITTLEKQLKASFTKIKAAESVVLANSPSSLKGHFVRVFAFDNMVFDQLSKANWSILALAKNAKSLEAGSLRIKPDLAAIEAYFAKCKK